MSKKIYIDTNLFVNYLFKKDHDSMSHLKNIEHGFDKGITSIFTIMETYTSGRKILADKTNLSLEVIDSKVKESLKYFYSMNNLHIIPDNGFDPLMSDILRDSIGYISKYKGNVRYIHGNRNYKGLYSPDAVHLALAIRYGCDEFLTADRDFDATDENIVVNNIL